MDTRYIQMEEWNGVQVDYYVYDTGMVCPLLLLLLTGHSTLLYQIWHIPSYTTQQDIYSSI